MFLAKEISPDNLIYEMLDGEPIYYKGYRDCLDGEKQPEEIIGSGYIQSLIITKLVFFLMSNLEERYLVLTNEVGIQFGEKSWRAADIAIMEKANLKNVDLGNKYLKVAPKIVIEIDTKAEIEEVQSSYGYFHLKTDELLNFGVERLIWIFTDSRKIMVAEKNKDWQIMDWSKDVPILGDLFVNIARLIEE